MQWRTVGWCVGATRGVGGGVWEEEVVFTLHPFQQNMLLPWQLLRLNVMLD